VTVETYFKDLLYRTVATYVETVLGLVTAIGFDVLDMSAWKAAAVAGLPAAFTVLKGGLAYFVGNSEQAALINTVPPAPVADSKE